MERLAELLAAAEGTIGGGGYLIFDGSSLPEPERAYLFMWAAYLAPSHQLLPPADELLPLAEYRLVYGDGPAAAAGAVSTTPAGSLHRLP